MTQEAETTPPMVSRLRAMGTSTTANQSGCEGDAALNEYIVTVLAVQEQVAVGGERRRVPERISGAGGSLRWTGFRSTMIVIWLPGDSGLVMDLLPPGVGGQRCADDDWIESASAIHRKGDAMYTACMN